MIDDLTGRLLSYATDLDFTERPAIGEYDVTQDIRAACANLANARTVLGEARAEVAEIRKNICEVHDAGQFVVAHPKFDEHAKREIARLDAMLGRIDAALSRPDQGTVAVSSAHRGGGK